MMTIEVIVLFQYTIRPGDTIYKLVTQFNVPFEAIISANPGINPYNLLIGQQILIPTTSYPTVPGPAAPFVRPPMRGPRYR